MPNWKIRSAAQLRCDGYYFFFAVLRTDRLRAGAAFFARFFVVDFFFIGITGLLKVCGPARRRDTPPRNFHYANKINKCLLRAENSSAEIEFGGGVGAIKKEVPATAASGLHQYDRLIMSARLGSPATARGGVAALGWRA